MAHLVDTFPPKYRTHTHGAVVGPFFLDNSLRPWDNH